MSIISTAHNRAQEAGAEPAFRHVPEGLAAEAICNIAGLSREALEHAGDHSGSDFQNIGIKLYRSLNDWRDSLYLARTPDGGLMKMLNSRICEWRFGKDSRTGAKIPCLEDHGLSIACLSTPGAGGRDHSSYRICFRDEIKRGDNGRVAPFRLKKAATPAPLPAPKPVKTAALPEQSSLFTSNFLSFETGRAR